MRKGISKIGADRGTLGNNATNMPNGGNLSHWIDSQIVRRFHGGAVVEHMGFVRLTNLFQHPTGNAAARHRVGEKLK